MADGWLVHSLLDSSSRSLLPGSPKLFFSGRVTCRQKLRLEIITLEDVARFIGRRNGQGFVSILFSRLGKKRGGAFSDDHHRNSGRRHDFTFTAYHDSKVYVVK
jgi:hypothetical protein